MKKINQHIKAGTISASMPSSLILLFMCILIGRPWLFLKSTYPFLLVILSGSILSGLIMSGIILLIEKLLAKKIPPIISAVLGLIPGGIIGFYLFLVFYYS